MFNVVSLAHRVAKWPAWVRYAITVGLVAMATLVRLALDPLLGEHYVYITYFAAALIAGLILNTGSSAVALVLGAVCSMYFFNEPRGSLEALEVHDWVGLAMYILTGGLVAALAEQIHAANISAQRSHSDAQAAMAARNQSEEEYRVAFDLAAVGKAQTDPANGRFLKVNDQFCEMTGYSREELLSLTFPEITHPEDIGPNMADYRRVAEGRAPSVVLEKRYIRKDGGIIWVRVAGALARDEEGRPWQVSATFEDITERRLGEEALRRSQNRFAHLANALPAFVWTARPDGQVDFINERWSRYTGLTLEESLGRGWTKALHPDEGERCARLWSKVREMGEPYETEARYRRADGEYRWFFTRAEPVRDESGAISAWFGTDIDIHDSKLAQERLARSASELARSNADLENFAHIAAHDLKEPLRGIRLTTGFLAEDAADKLDEKERANLVALDRLATRMHDLLDAMLEYSRVGRSGLDLQETDLAALIDDIKSDLGGRLEEENARVFVRGPLPTARCDATLVATIFVNLITNAVKYNKSDPKIVEIGSKTDGSRPVYYVKDNGIGIDPRHTDQVFRMFKRLHPRERFGGGTGAGLAIVKKIVERHGGQIWFESAAQGGSTFYFTLTPARVSEHEGFPGRAETATSRARANGSKLPLGTPQLQPGHPRPADGAAPSPPRPGD